MNTSLVGFFLPYEFSPVVLLVCLAALVFYVRGLGRAPASPGIGRPLAYILGVAGMYFVMQTHYDFWSQHMFFIHRIQHLVLHHLAPFLIALSAPQYVLAHGTPELVLRPLRAFWQYPATQRVYGGLQHPVVAPILFVGLIYLWLIPSIHFYAMLSRPLYALMNWSMAIDGLLFWWLMFHPKFQGKSTKRIYGSRILILFLITWPQIFIGAYLSLSGQDIFSVYAVCGRIWPVSPTVDQQIGGLVTWIPAAMMSLFGALVVLRQWLRTERMNEATNS